MESIEHNFDNEREDWAPDEWGAIQSGRISRLDDTWMVGHWKVWRGWCDDAHERLYRSPRGQYYLGSVRYQGWCDVFWRKGTLVPPYQDEAEWLKNPVQAAPPPSMLYVESELECYADVFEIARRRPLEFMRVVAAAWFIDRAEGAGENGWPYDCPPELVAPIRHLEILRLKDDRPV